MENNQPNTTLCLKDDSAAGLFDLLFSFEADVASLHDARDLDVAAAEQLRKTVRQQVDNWQSITLFGLCRFSRRNQLRHIREVEGGLPVRVCLLVEVAHPALAEVPRVVLVHVDSVVVLPASITTTRRVLAVLAHATVATERATAHLARLLQTSRHLFKLQLSEEEER